MFKPHVILALMLACLCAPLHADEARTVVNDQQAKQQLLGLHRLSLQWVSWDQFGEANVVESDGVLRITGEQARDDDYVRMDGTIMQVDAKSFIFNGRIVTRVSHINEGQPCTRQGEMTFRMIGARKYWRLKEMENPCDRPVVDYVDIFLR